MRRARGAELAALFEETVALYHQLSAAASSIHGFGPVSGPRRTILVALARSGLQTVAHMARARAQSRQRFQPLVNGLIAEGLVGARPNPMHKRSPLIALTARGEKAAKRIEQTEGILRARLKLASSPQSLGRAATVLRDVRAAMAQQLPRLLSHRGKS